MNQTFKYIELKKKMNYFYLIDYVVMMIQATKELESYTELADEMRKDLRGENDTIAKVLRENLDKFDGALEQNRIIIRKAKILLAKPKVEEKLKSFNFDGIVNPFDNITVYYNHIDSLIFSLFMTQNQLILKQMSGEMGRGESFRNLKVEDVKNEISLEMDDLKARYEWYKQLQEAIQMCVDEIGKDYVKRLPDAAKTTVKTLDLLREGFSALLIFANSESVQALGEKSKNRIENFYNSLIKLRLKYGKKG
jgi:hypothetical protein